MGRSPRQRGSRRRLGARTITIRPAVRRFEPCSILVKTVARDAPPGSSAFLSPLSLRRSLPDGPTPPRLLSNASSPAGQAKLNFSLSGTGQREAERGCRTLRSYEAMRLMKASARFQSSPTSGRGNRRPASILTFVARAVPLRQLRRPKMLPWACSRAHDVSTRIVGAAAATATATVRLWLRPSAAANGLDRGRLADLRHPESAGDDVLLAVRPATLAGGNDHGLRRHLQHRQAP